MVHEREPPRIATPQNAAQHALQDRTNTPEFGKPSPLRNTLKQGLRIGANGSGAPSQGHTESHRPILPAAKASPRTTPPTRHVPSIFNVPRPGQERAEHHRSARPIPTIVPARNPADPPFRRPRNLSRPAASPDVVEIPRPVNFIHKTTAAAPRTLYSSSNTAGLPPANAFKVPGQTIDLTKTADDDDHDFDPDQALVDDKFGAFDPNNYMDAAQASENIKALLEGAFEDDNDKPKTRSRKKKHDAAATMLADKMQALDIDNEVAQVEEEEEDDGTVEGLTVKLLPHQIAGLAWMLDKEIGERKRNGVLPKGGILADDMGLGKTIQALSLILSNPRPYEDDFAQNPKRKIPKAAGKATLVVAPLALIKQWESEIKTKVDKFPKMKVLVHHGPSRTKSFEVLKKYDTVITTYQTLLSEHEGSSESDEGLKVGCFGVHWYRIILDEAHSIKNRNAKTTKAAYALRSVYRWCLTGTPMQNNLDELQSLICFLRIKPYNELRNWKDQISQPMKNGRGGLAMKRLQYFLKAFMKRRTKDVLKKEGGLNFGRNTQANGEPKNGGFKIVGREVKTVVAEFDEHERVLYDRLAARTEKSLENMMGSTKNDYIGALVLLLRLRQTCNHPELIRGNLRKEKELGSQGAGGFQTPHKASVAEGLDDIADMFGALTVETKKCDICQTKLHKEDVVAGSIRCKDWEEDINTHRRRTIEHTTSTKTKKQSPMKQQTPRKLHTRRILDSDDEDEGDWVVPEKEQIVQDLEKAGGSDDEDAEGGGEWLQEDDSDTGDEESELKVSVFSQKARISTATILDTNDVDSTSGEEESEVDRSNNETPKLVSSTKIRQLMQILHEESRVHKFIVFSEFTSMLDMVEPFMHKEGFRFTRYDGSMKNDDREASLERLRNDPRTRILLCSLRCGSLGLNLTAASRVVIMEPFWNPFVEEQAIDRVHRLNQTHDVVVYRLTIANSVEERILDLQEKKRELAKAAIEGGKAVGKLNMKDILSLFRRDAEHDGRHEEDDTLKLGGIAAGRSAGLLAPGGGMATPAKSSAPTGRSERRDGVAAKWQVPKSMQKQFDESFGRRW